MKTVILVLTYATLATSSAVRDKRSWTYTQAYPVSNTLPIYEYPESTEIHTQAKTIYSVSVPITHTVHLEQPEYSRQIIYHNPPTTYYNNYHVPQYTQQVYTPQVYSPWPYQRYADTWC
ncbi:uncharacterized protein LOC133526007 [Cydia pomonella]|uniref:uncharacterized protein LOC133526007 n=1 Tax=Cydia pomonella TaxID=82600 RepID=UPI002ADD7164|nr:uncharacterized protein LOC133526007 [Cydia pomonella]